jgi:hypothetical protein
MATSLSLENDSSLAQGYLKVNGSTAATLTTSGITGNLVGDVTGNVTGSLTSGGSLTLATAQTASGTAVDFTGIPSWAKRITVMFNGVSTSAVGPISNLQIQIGSGSIATTGYTSSAWTSNTSNVTSSSGFLLTGTNNLNATYHGNIIISTFGSNIWIESHSLGGTASYNSMGGGSIALSGTLDRLRITHINGTDTFDAGTINISFEG